ncbi:cobalamin biosynthesis protein CobD [Paenibacillaceae bacterium]|nr:cobalamin biosynthesis protein CobD [Paenibacillaceae bacterium]
MLLYSLSEILWMIAAAIALDWIIGDPRFITHPVILIGRLIKVLERALRSGEKQVLQAGSIDTSWSGTQLRWRGVVLTGVTVTVAGLITLLVLLGLQLIHPWLGYAANIWLIAATIAVKGLREAAMKVYVPLMEGQTDEAAEYAGQIVSRDMKGQEASQISRAAVETVAENTVDALISPLFFALIGAAPLAMLYRAANTLDSMVGYKNEKYYYFGWASARFDDVLNYVPARLTGLLLLAAALPLRGLSVGSGWRAIRTFARRHPSPNSGIPESAVAGLLGIELGGLNYYFGVPNERARLGWPHRQLTGSDIVRTVQLLYGVSMICFAGGVIGWWLVY